MEGKLITDNSKELIDEKDQAIMRALEIIGGMAERYAKQNLTEKKAVDTGLLRNSVTYAISGKQPAISTYHADRGSTRKTADSKDAGTVSVGFYRGTIGDEGEKAVYIGTNVRYAPFIELGSSKQKPRPFLKPSAEQHLTKYRQVIEREAKKVK